MSTSEAAIQPHEISELRQLADKAGLEGESDTYRQLHALLDAYEDGAVTESKAKRLKEFEDALKPVKDARKAILAQVTEIEKVGNGIEADRPELADMLLNVRQELRAIEVNIFEAMPVAERPPKKPTRRTRS